MASCHKLSYISSPRRKFLTKNDNCDSHQGLMRSVGFLKKGGRMDFLESQVNRILFLHKPFDMSSLQIERTMLKCTLSLSLSHDSFSPTCRCVQHDTPFVYCPEAVFRFFACQVTLETTAATNEVKGQFQENCTTILDLGQTFLRTFTFTTIFLLYFTLQYFTSFFKFRSEMAPYHFVSACKPSSSWDETK